MLRRSGGLREPGGEATGGEQLEAVWQGVRDASGGELRHWINNLVIDGEGDLATGSCYLLTFTVGGDAGPALARSGLYVDRLVRVDDEWRFARREITPDS